MKLLIQNAKNNQKTALLNNNFLHSNYNPSKEAERFVDNINFPYNAKYIILTEPALSYCILYLKKKFPHIKIGCIRYIKGFEEYNKDFDFVINYFDYNDCNNFENSLFNKLGEENILLSYFVKWEPSCKILIDIDTIVWKGIKNVMEKAKTLLITRQYFEKKWLLNSISFFKNIRNLVKFNNTINSPIFIISSGPSLINYIDFIKSNQDKVFIVCLSSAISACLKNNIIPDLCLSTDGGYWAGQHLKKLYQYNITLALTPESYCPHKLLQKLPILPLDYNDGISSLIYNKLGLNSFAAVRNGTISGTALQFCLSLTDSSVYFFGLDLSAQKGFQHIQPNELNLNNSFTESKICSSDLSSIKSEYSSGSLDIYLNWFKSFDTNSRNVYRVIDSEYKKNDLVNIKDISYKELNNIFSSSHIINKKELFASEKINYSNEYFYKVVTDILNIEDIKHQLYPLDYVHYEHEHNNEIIDKINSNYLKLQNKIWKILND